MSSKIKLSYFDFHGGRGEPARLALAIGGLDFEDDRIAPRDWGERKKQMPFGSVPVLEVDGRRLTQSNAICRYLGRLTGLYPEDAWQAALCDEVLDAVEDYNHALGRTFGISDPDALRDARDKFVAGKLTQSLTAIERLLRDHGGEWFADGRLTVADLKVYDMVRQLKSGKLDHVPTDIVERVAPTLAAHHARVLAQPGVKAYYDRVKGPAAS
jgi:glutathione S-transferase